MAERHFVNGGGGGPWMWGTSANWSLTEGGAGGAGVPTAAEDVFLDAGSPNCTIQAAAVCKTFTATNYVATIFFNAYLRVSGNITLGAGMTFGGSPPVPANYLGMIADGTWTTNGKTIVQDVYIGLSTLASGTFTLADNLTTSGKIWFECTTSTTLIGDFHITAGSARIAGSQTVTIIHDVTITGQTEINTITVLDGAFNWNTGGLLLSAACSGAATFILTGGTWSASSTISNNLTFAGNVTVSGVVSYNTGTLLYSSGSITTTDSVLTISLTVAGLNVSAITWNNIYFTGATLTIPLLSALVSTGWMAFLTTTSVTFTGAFPISAGTCTMSGGLIITISEAVTISGLTNCTTAASVIDGAFHWHTGGLTTTTSITGTATIVLTGGTWTGAAGSVSNNLIFDGNSAISGTVISLAPTVTWVSGTITVGTSIFSQRAACVWDTDEMSFANITITTGNHTFSSPITLTGDLIISAASTLTLNGLLTVAGTMTLPNAAITFAGSAGFIVGTLANTTIATSAKTVTFVSGITYAITTAMNSKGASATLKLNFVVSTPGTKAILTLAYTATQSVAFVFPTDIDSSLGQVIYSYGGTIVTSYNWATILGNGQIIPTAGGEASIVAGITKDKDGVALGSCDVYLFRDNGNDTAIFIAYVESDPVTGAYSFTVFPGSSYFVVAFKSGATPVMDVTYRDLAAV